MEDYSNIEGYEPLFELGLFNDESPACRVIPANATICPITLAALATALFETAMNSVPECSQNDFEQQFLDSFEYMLQERFEYDVIKKYPDEE